MELRNLKELAENLRNSFASSFDPSDRKLPQSFKDRVTKINSFNLTYNDYSVMFGGSTGSLDSYIPNQLFYIAAHYNEYTQQLFYYKSEIMKVINASGFSGDLTKFFTSEREIKNREDSQFYAILKDQDIKEDDKELLYKFVTDYNWWHGAKTIDRQDFFHSPILNVMGMTASSNSTLAMICGFFANKPEVADLLNSSDNFSINTLISDKALTSFILRCIKELNNIDGLNSLIPYITSPISEGKPIKIASAEDGFSLTGMFLETTEEDRIARNEKFPRWFPDLFTLDGHQVYLSTQWNGRGDYQLTKADFVRMLEVCYPNRFSCIVDEVPHTLRVFSPETQSTPHQTIYFGSPGTGKSHGVKKLIAKAKENNPRIIEIRTTFHPDTDYASFVGAYKPVLQKDTKVSRKYSEDELAAIYVKDVVPTEHLATGHIEPRIKFGIEYCQHFGGNLANYSINRILELAGIELATGCMEDRIGRTYVKYGINVGLNLKQTHPTSTISYEFVPQVFTKAYVEAWNNLEQNTPVYLIIEEINRGNCAQVFGDLFQLLDRKENGYSEYPVEADTDLANYLIDTLGWGDQHPGIKEGLCLPPNLHILATMNTSDQSLFPMDSAFKRRWEWKFIPTTPPKGEERTLNLSFDKETKTEYKTIINAGDYEYSWTEFLSKINSKIQKATHSEDKQLGFWFVKANYHSNEISISTFVSKVVFYLWNDVFKDMGAKDTNPFTIVFEGKNQLMSYNSFFETNCEGKVVENIGVLHTFLRNVGMEPNVKDEVIKTLEEAQKLEAEQR